MNNNTLIKTERPGMIRAKIIAASLMLPFTTSALAQAVAEQTNVPESRGYLEVVTVTAKKRASAKQETPIAISAFSDEDLARQNIDNAQDIQFAIPNALFTDRGTFNIRGVGNNARGSTSESGTGFHVNGVYITVPNSQNEFYDLKTIEILRGPQGTLYGRNTTAGVVNVLTQRPEDDFGGLLKVELSNYNSVRTVGAINIPITENIKQRFAINTVRRDGYTENIKTGNDIDGRDQYSVRSTTLFEFSDNFDVTLFAQYFEEDSNRSNRAGVRCIADAVLGCSADKTGFEFVNSDFTDGNIKNRLALFGIDPNTLQRPDFYNFDAQGNRKINPSDPYKVNIDDEPILQSDELLAFIELNYVLESGTITSITAYHDRSNEGQRDFDNANGSDAYLVPVSYAFNDNTVLQNTTDFRPVQVFDSSSEQLSQEIRFVSDNDSNFNYTTGLYWLNYKADTRVSTYYPTLALIGGLLNLPRQFHDFDTISPEVETTSWAVFSEMYYNFSDSLKLTVGIRYSDEEKSQQSSTVNPFSFINPNFDPRQPVSPTNSVLNPNFDPTQLESLSNNWQETTGKIGLDYLADFSFTDETLLYGTVSRGYKAGGLNPGGAVNQAFDAEYINSVEVGIKNTLFDRRLQANATLFYYDYDGLQLGSIEPSATGAVITDNTEAEITGAEFEFLATPISNLLINLNVSLLNSEVTGNFATPDISQPSGTGFVDVQGNSLPYAPETSIQFGIQYTQQLLDSMEIAYRAQTYWQDEFQARIYNTTTDSIDSWEQTDLSVALSHLEQNWEIEAFVKNVENKGSVTGLTVENTLAGRFRLPVVLDPRSYGVRINYRFD